MCSETLGWLVAELQECIRQLRKCLVFWACSAVGSCHPVDVRSVKLSWKEGGPEQGGVEVPPVPGRILLPTVMCAAFSPGNDYEMTVEGLSSGPGVPHRCFGNRHSNAA